MSTKHEIKRVIIKNFALVKKAKFFQKHHLTFTCSVNNSYVNEELKRAKEVVENSKTKKKKKTSLILLIINAVVIAGFITYYALTSGIVSFRDLIYLDIRYRFLFLAIAMVVLMILIEAFRMFLLIKKSTGQNRFGLSLKTHLIGRYYDNITPFAIGGQPFQVFYLNSHGIDADKAVSIPVSKQIFSTITMVLIGLVVLISNIFFKFTYHPLIIILALISLFANGLLIFLMLIFSINRRVGASLVIKVLKFLNKLHLVKNYKATFFKVNRFVVNYQKTMKQLSKNTLLFIAQILLTFLVYAANFALVYFIYLAFSPLIGGAKVGYFEIVCCLTLCDLSASIMPLPGGTGLAEFSFDALFKGWFSLSVFPWALFIWRTLSCYIYMFIGVIYIIVSFIKSFRGNRKIKKENKKNKIDS